MKACKLCGAEYSERISFCFNDGEVLVVAGAGAVGVVSDPFDVPNPGQIPPAMPPTHVARTPVPAARSDRSLVNTQDASQSPLAQRPPAQPEPDDFTPRPLQPLDVDPNAENGPAEPMYSPPEGMDLDEVPPPAPISAPPPEPAAPPQGLDNREPIEPPPAAAPPQNDDGTSQTALLLVAGFVVVAAIMLIVVITGVIGVTSTASSDDDGAAIAEAIPAPEPVAPTPAHEPDDMDIPTPDPLDLGLPPEPQPQPQPVAEPEPAGQGTAPEPAGNQGSDGTGVAPEPVVDGGEAGADGGDAVVVVVPAPQPDEANPWGALPEPGGTPEPQPAAEAAVAFTTSPSGAELLIDGVAVGKTPVTHTLGYGDHEVTVRLAGHVSQRKTLTVAEGTRSFAVELPKIEVANVRFEAPGRDGDTLFVDGRPIGTLPREVEVKPGSHTFTVEGPGGPRLTVTRDVTMADTRITLQ